MSDLSDLGLSSYEEQAYRALLATGPETARTVADRSGVPAGRIYDVLNGLEARGIVDSRPGEPRLYAPVDPDEAVDRLVDERLAELDAQAERYRDLAADVRSSLTPTPPIDGSVWLADLGDEDATTVIGEQLESVTDRFAMAVGPPYVGASPEAYAAEIEATVDHLPSETDVAVDVLLDRTLVDELAETETVPRLRDADAEIDLRIRQLEGVTVAFDVVDGTEAYVDVPHPFADGRRFGFVEIRDATVAREFERVFDAAWADADPVAVA